MESQPLFTYPQVCNLQRPHCEVAGVLFLYEGHLEVNVIKCQLVVLQVSGRVVLVTLYLQFLKHLKSQNLIDKIA